MRHVSHFGIGEATWRRTLNELMQVGWQELEDEVEIVFVEDQLLESHKVGMATQRL